MMRTYAQKVPVRKHQPVLGNQGASNIDLGRRAFLRLSTGILAFGTTAPMWGDTTRAPSRASTSRASREQAVKSIPLGNLREPMRSNIHRIVTNPTIYRRMPVEVIPCDPDLFLFLVRYPEVVVNMWQLMGVTKVSIKRTGQYSCDAKDGAGTDSQVQLVYGTREKHLFLAEGFYDGPLLPRRVTGRSVLLLSSAYSKDANRRPLISNRLDVFVQLDNVGAELVAKTLHLFLGRTADSNFSESTRFVAQVSQVVEQNGPGVQRLATQLTNVTPEVRSQFAELAAAINQRAVMQTVNTKNAAAARVSDGTKY